MADEFRDENAEELEGMDPEESLDAQDLGAEEDSSEDFSEAQTEEDAMGDGEKSEAEILAEQAMLAELEASANDDDSDEPFPVETSDGVIPESSKNLDLLLDVTLNITVELGRKEMKFGDVLNLGKGSLVELNKIADEPVDIYVNQSKIAEGEVVVVDDHFGVRITRLVSAEKIRNFT